MWIFLRNLAIFLLPLFALAAFPLFIFLKSGETVPYPDVARRQLSGEQILFGRAYSDVDRDYKIYAAGLRGARVVAIGSSRAMYIRSEYFLPNVTFYNAGGAARELWGFSLFVRNIPEEKRPAVILMGIDQRWFKNDYSTTTNIVYPSNDPTWRDFLRYSWKKIYQDYAKKKFTLRELFAAHPTTTPIGLTAVAHGSGFRSDGSIYSKGFIVDPNKQNILKGALESAVADTKPGQLNYDYGNEINRGSLQVVEEFLNECEKDQITVLGYLSPMAPSLYKRVDSVNGPQEKELRQELEKAFSKHQYHFYDLSDSMLYGGRDEEFIGDPRHGSDKLFARAFIYLAQKDPVVEQLIDVEKLKAALVSSTDDQQVFPD